MSRAVLAMFSVALALVIPLAPRAHGEEGSARPHVLTIALEDQSINPVTARFIDRALRRAESTGAQCLIVQLDTPGGLMESTRRIVKDILQAEVPVVVYVAPRGARAGSAGVFITLAAHVAAMAPGTNIGAAHPIVLPGLGGDGETSKNAAPNPLSEKVLNDAVAWARSLAEYRGRNADWAARAVKESVSTPASQAVKEHVVDFLADDQHELLERLDGRKVSLPGRTVVLHTRGATVDHLEMSWSERLLDLLTNPTLAYLLLLLGFSGLLFEITHPGLWAPGIVGLICLVLAFFAFQMLPINYAGLVLLVLGLVLVALEVKVHSLGLLTLSGVACLLLGSFMLVEPVPGIGRVSWLVGAPVSTALALIVLFLVGNVVRTHRMPVHTGMDGLLGTEGIVRGDFDGQGYVFVHGELWRAHGDEPLRTGQRVRIQGYDGLTLRVERVAESGQTK